MNHEELLKSLYADLKRKKRVSENIEPIKQEMKRVYLALDRQCRISGHCINNFITDFKLLEYCRRLVR